VELHSNANFPSLVNLTQSVKRQKKSTRVHVI